MRETRKLAPDRWGFLRAYWFGDYRSATFIRAKLHRGTANEHPYGERLVGVWKIKYKILK